MSAAISRHRLPRFLAPAALVVFTTACSSNETKAAGATSTTSTPATTENDASSAPPIAPVAPGAEDGGGARDADVAADGGGAPDGASASDAGCANDCADAPSGTSPQANTFGGVQMFPADDWYNLDISKAPLAANSSADIADLAAKISASGKAQRFQSPFATAVFDLVPAGAPSAIMVGCMSACGSGHTIAPASWPIADSTSLPYRTGALPYQADEDGYLIVVQQAGSGAPNTLWVSGYTTRKSATSWTAYGGERYDLDVAYAGPSDTGVSTSGAPMRAFSPRPDEFIRGVIAHVVDGEFPRSTTCAASQWPLPSGGQGEIETAPCVPGGAKLRLQASFPEAGWSGDALVMLHQLKTYGVAVADNGDAPGIYFARKQTGNGGVPADARDIDYSSTQHGLAGLFAAMPITDFEEVAGCPTGTTAKGSCVYAGSNP